MRTKPAPDVVLVLLELDLGVMFCEVAHASHNVLTARRNIGNAKKAWSVRALLRALQGRVVLSGAEQKSFNSKKESHQQSCLNNRLPRAAISSRIKADFKPPWTLVG